MSMNTVLIGDASLLVHCAERLLARGGAVEAVVTGADPVADWARGKGIAVIAPGGGLADALAGLHFDWLLSIANLSVLPESVLALPRKGAVNFHDGPLPFRAGLNTPVWALIEGEATHGITWHLVEPGIDTGDVLVARSFPITDSDTALSLNTRAFEAGLSSFDALLDQLESGVLARTPQDLSRRRYHARDDRPAGHALLDFRQPAAVLERLVRALDHGPYRNPLALPKLRHGGRLVAVGQARMTGGDAAPGMVLAADEAALMVACGDGALVLTGLRDVSDAAALSGNGIAAPGERLACPEGEELAALDERVRRVVRHERVWRDRIGAHKPLALPGERIGEGAVEARPLALGGATDLASVALWAARMARPGEAIAWRDAALADLSRGGVVADWVPLRLPGVEGSMAALDAAMADEIASLRTLGGFTADLPLRDPALRPLAQPALGLSDGAGAIAGCALTVELGGRPMLHVDPARIDPDMAERLARRLEVIARAASPDADPAALPQMHPDERAALIDLPNATKVPFDENLTIHAAFEAQVDRTPDATAAIFEDRAVSYAALDARANRIAHVLRARGVAPGAVVGLCLPRGIDLVAGALGILKAGGAYLPMDPAYPQARLRHVLDDSGARVVVTNAVLAGTLPDGLEVLALDADPAIAAASDARPEGGASGGDMAYLIYTSGSTGAPKGVMIEHRAVSNFFTGMDAHVPHAPGDTWLAVTSLSFDISVLELFWTLARGLRVVIAGDAPARNAVGSTPGGGMDFSLYYWGNDDGAGGDKYRLLLDGARFADDNGFAAVWTPERHFHAFGGPYPNPSVTGAAVAAVTHKIGVRGGSVVAPLHHPARIAEEWAVIDNLTGGRAGMAIASGWQPDDFVLRPENAPPDNKRAAEEALDQVRRLWRGEAVEFPRADGSLQAVVTQPRAVSAELPVWLTTAGNPETWRQAGALGCHVLTHLLGQSVDEVAGKIAIYHEALQDAGHDPADFAVTLMLHTFLSDSRERAREVARGPMKDYLRASAGLIKQYAWAFPAFRRPKGVDNAFDLTLDEVTPDDLDAILDFAFERYFTDSGLFGTVEDALARVDALRAIGVTEVACLIDYGIDADTVLAGLRPLARVVQARRGTGPAADDFSIAAQIARHGVTHLQCTPSMARLLLADPGTRAALGRVRHLFLGGEPVPGALVRDLAAASDATLTAFYGPTEATIWSAANRAAPQDGTVGLGRPIANTQLYVLNGARQPVPLGAEGELWIGGAGVARGYWNLPDLTAERFVDNPFHGGRMYRTGDLVRRDPDGALLFLGRADDQIKLRGHRIEPAEIEAALEAQDGVTQAVVIAHTADAGDVRLIAYHTGDARDPAALRAALGARLPAYMVPGHLVHLETFPLTPNRKIDRAALAARAPESLAADAGPAANAIRAPAENAPVAPLRDAGRAPISVQDTAHVQDRLAALWQRVLGISRAGPRDNFFDLGGHSLLAVRVHRDIRDALEVPDLTITDIFRFPVLADLAARVAALRGAQPEPPPPAAAEMRDTVTAREAAMARRRAMRARRPA